MRTASQDVLDNFRGEHDTLLQEEVGARSHLQSFANLLQGFAQGSAAWQGTAERHRLLPAHPRHAPLQANIRVAKPKPADGLEVAKKRPALLLLGYTGTNYYGLESHLHMPEHARRPTVGDTLRQALLEEGFIRPSNFQSLQRVKWKVASRTDKGVHAAFAAVSLRLELYQNDTIGQDELAAAGDPAALEYIRVKEGRIPGNADRVPEWQLSASAIQRINARLPADIRLFSGSRVRKRFDARFQAAARVYEYLLPSRVVGASAAELDTVLRTFEGTHRFHNFAKGLRSNDQNCDLFRGRMAENGTLLTATFENQSLGGMADAHKNEFAWALGVDEKAAKQGENHRSILSCRVSRTIHIDGEEYFVVRISGLAFVLHQIRHMIGAALAVTNGKVPLDIMPIALDTPLRVDMSPLAPGCGLLLDEVSWFDMKEGIYDVHVPPAMRTALEAFKEEVLYPHVHQLYQNGDFDDFYDEYFNSSYTNPHRNQSFTKFHTAEEYDMIRRAGAAWGPYSIRRAKQRKALREAKAAYENKSAEEAKLPGGLYVAICRHFQVLPCPATHRAMELLRAKLASGELDTEQRKYDYDYYLRILDAEWTELSQKHEAEAAPAIR